MEIALKNKKVAWKSKKDGFSESLHYLKGRMDGHIKSIQTPWPKFNDAGCDGLEWHTTTVIGGRPGSGKTLIKDQIIRESFKLNPGEDFRVLEFQLEMLARASAIRQYSSFTGKSYTELCTKLTPEQLKACHEYAKEAVKYPVDIVEEPCTVPEFITIIKQYMETHAITEPTHKPPGEPQTMKVYKKTIITLDHTILLKKAPFEKDKMDTLYALGEALTTLKRIFPIAFIVLSQLNRNIDNPERCEDGKYGNFILESDFFGADAMLQHADILVGINKPSKQRINFYGPDRYIIQKDTLVLHFIKCRNGEPRMSFFKENFAQMRVAEIPTPPTQERKINTRN